MREIWDQAQSGQLLDQELSLLARLATTTAVDQCEGIVRAAYDVAGASAVRWPGVLQRLYRDASYLTHHISANGDSFERVGRVRGGFDLLDFRI
jgi:alkylation response protein AidB-like acyl-CoA dehydrogenase